MNSILRWARRQRFNFLRGLELRAVDFLRDRDYLVTKRSEFHNDFAIQVTQGRLSPETWAELEDACADPLVGPSFKEIVGTR